MSRTYKLLFANWRSEFFQPNKKVSSIQYHLFALLQLVLSERSYLHNQFWVQTEVALCWVGHLIRLVMYSFLVKLIQIWGDPRILAAFRICFKGSEAIDIQSRRPGVTVSRGARVKRSEICVSKSGNCLLSWISIINSVWSH